MLLVLLIQEGRQGSLCRFFQVSATLSFHHSWYLVPPCNTGIATSWQWPFPSQSAQSCLFRTVPALHHPEPGLSIAHICTSQHCFKDTSSWSDRTSRYRIKTVSKFCAAHIEPIDHQLLSNSSNTKVLSSKEQPESGACTKPQMTLGMSAVRKEFTG